MWRTVLMMGLGLVCSSALIASAETPALATVKLRSQVPAIVSQLRAQGSLAADTNLNLAIGLPLRNHAEMTNLLAQLYDPASTNYHHFLTPDEFTARFGPTPDDYAKVLNFAKVSGFKVTGTHPNRMLVDVSGKAADVQKAFHVALRTYRHPTEKRDFFAPDSDPTVPQAVPILHVQGMDNYQLPRPWLQKQASGSARPGNGSAPYGGYMGRDFRNAYVPGTPLNGAGQVVGLLQFDGFFASDIAAYESTAGLTNVPLQTVLLDGFNGVPYSPDGESEVCLDIDMVISMAPGVAKVVLFEAGPFGNPDDVLNSMASSNQIKQLSASWGYGIDATTEQIYQQFALQGQTFLNASGDGDAWVGPIPYGSCEDPYITIVGGTTLTMNGTATSYISEQAWNWGNVGGYNWNVDGYVGTSGGVSTDVASPAWQQGFNMVTNHGSTTYRCVPDVALTGDNVYLIYDGGLDGIFGGTSAASPLWAGYMALVNQQAASKGSAPVGFLAPAVYSLAKTASYTNYFHDVTAGDNTWDRSLTNFFAVPGYDLCTGLGTPNGTNLINALTGVSSNFITHLSPPAPPYGTTLSSLNGGNPNGSWELFVIDDQMPNSGMISNGWVLNLTSANPVGASADLALTMAATPATLGLGSPFTLTLAVTNYGPSISTNVVVSDTFPQGITIVSATPTLGSVTGGNWTLGSPLPPGSGAQLTYVVRPNGTGTLFNYALASAATPDANPADDFASTNITVVTSGLPQLSASLVDANHHFQFSVTDMAQQAYVIEASTNLVDWVPIFTNPTPATPITSFSDSNTPSYQSRFYRVILQ